LRINYKGNGEVEGGKRGQGSRGHGYQGVESGSILKYYKYSK
jgi:hypothetical protein